MERDKAKLMELENQRLKEEKEKLMNDLQETQKIQVPTGPSVEEIEKLRQANEKSKNLRDQFKKLAG